MLAVPRADLNTDRIIDGHRHGGPDPDPLQRGAVQESRVLHRYGGPKSIPVRCSLPIPLEKHQEKHAVKNDLKR